jgi:broad specificity phosphatase PhoE
MRIYITRHGETQWNKLGRMQGWKNSDLTEKGIENARKLGKSLEAIPFDIVYTSPSGRTIETAKLIMGNRDVPIVEREELKEMGFGTWEGMDHEAVEELYPEERHIFWNKPHLYKPIDGESFEELISRVKKVLQDIMESAAGENILIVSHGVTIKAMYAILKGYELEEIWKPPFMHDTCLTVLEVKDGKVEFVLEGDVSHLDKDLCC